MDAPEQIAPGAWRLRRTRGCNVYALRLDDGSLALVDSGSPGNLPVIEAQIEALALGPPRALLLTHRHWDHAGTAPALREAFALRVMAGEGDVTRSRAGPVLRADAERARRLFGPVHVDDTLPGDRECEPLPGVRAIPVPGHTHGSLCFLVPDRELLFLGDLALDGGGRLRRPLRAANDDNTRYEASLREMAERAPRHGAPGHGSPVLGDCDRRLREMVARGAGRGPSWWRVLRNPRQVTRFMWTSMRGLR